MSDDETRKLILARRAKFVAAAIASVGIACGKTTEPVPCLSPPPQDPDASVTSPQPCLSVAIPVDPVPPDAGNNIQVDPDAGPAPAPCLSPMPADAGAPVPRPCLKVAQPKPPPQPCLSVAPKPPSPTK